MWKGVYVGDPRIIVGVWTGLLMVGFVGEMRKCSIKLHSKDQAAEGGQAEKPKPFNKWVFTREGYLNFLVESKIVYNAIDDIIQGSPNPVYALFAKNGLERSAAIDKDIAWMKTTYGLDTPDPQPDGPGSTYAQILIDLSVADPPAFICHFYNFYLAHTAGGTMIGKKVADSALDGKFSELAFYKYDEDVKSMVINFKHLVNQVAEAWSREEKDHCLEETKRSFLMSGNILQALFA